MPTASSVVKKEARQAREAAGQGTRGRKRNNNNSKNKKMVGRRERNGQMATVRGTDFRVWCLAEMAGVRV